MPSTQDDPPPRRRRADFEEQPEAGSIEYRLGQHSALIATLRADHQDATKRLDVIENKLDTSITAHEQQYSALTAQITALDTTVQATFQDHAPLLAYVEEAQAATQELRARDAQREFEAAARHQALAQRLNVVLPVALAMLASTILRNLETISTVDQAWVQAGIAAVAGLYIVTVLVVLPRYDRAHVARVDGIEAPPHHHL